MADKVSDQVPNVPVEATTAPQSGADTSSQQNSPSHSGGGGGGSWWGSWIDTAKSKSASVLEAVKKDLDELTTVVKTEATNAGTAIADTLNLQEPESTANTVKKSLSTFFGQVSEVLSPTLTEDDDTEAILITKDGAVTLTGFHKHLAELQSNDDIYLIEPDLELAEKYTRWMEVVDQDQFTQQRLDRQLQSSHILQEKYERLVPKEVTHMHFWQRYLFKRALLEDALANASLVERRARQEMNSNAHVTSPGKKIIQTEQPKRVKGDEDEVQAEVAVFTSSSGVKETDVAEEVSPKLEPMASIDEELSKLAEKDLKWANADITCDVELSEEEQARLLAEYEQEMKDRERKTSTVGQGQKINTPKKEQQVKGQGNKAGQNKGQQPQGKGLAQQQGSKNVKGGNAKGKNVGGQKAVVAGKDEKGVTTAVKDDSDESWEKEFDLDE